MLKAIDTVHNGYKFRSRLEARWAIFLEGIGAKYDYEPEGFDLGDGKRYLPDFIFTFQSESFWLEVKPDSCEGQQASRADDLMSRLVQHSRQSGFLVFGVPGSELTVLYEPTAALGLKAVRSLADLGCWPNAVAAQLAARQARFEHGERKVA